MTLNISSRRRTAIILLLIWTTNLIVPSVSYALTSGPGQPESKGFQPAGVSDMVDLFSGDFKYNIPLLEVDGYPINLNYQSGTGMDDEATWVGLGWNLNVGAINRQMRGVPDDFSGDKVIGDEAVTEHYTKPKITVGGRLTAKVEAFGKVKTPGANGSVSFGVFSDNYTGIGAELGANAGISFSLANSGMLTSGMGVGVTSSTASGVDVSPYVSLSIKDNSDNNATSRAGLSGSLGYNTRSGMKTLTFGSSVGLSAVNNEGKNGSVGFSVASSTITYNTELVNPKIQIPYHTSYGSFSIDAGGMVYGVFVGGGGTGYKSVRKIQSRTLKNPAYGFLYADRGKDQENAMMDFIREKENPIIPGIPNLALPVATPDLFSYTSQSGSGQFRLYRGGTGVFFDNKAADESEMSTIGGDIGFGAYVHGGVTIFEQGTSNITKKWQSPDNAYLQKGEFQTPSSNPDEQQVYFKMVGEKNMEDSSMTAQLFDTKALAININKKNTLTSFRDNANNISTIPDVIKKKKRQVVRTSISFLTAAEASHSGLEKKIQAYPFNIYGSFVPQTSYEAQPAFEERISTTRKGHHISELSVTDESGKRMLYGIPVYNLKQDEYSFAVGLRGSEYQPIAKTNLLTLDSTQTTVPHERGVDHYFHRESQAGYASSYLLTGVLSPDYQDKTGDGITKDDQGTALRFKYSKLPYNYKWRTPYSNATLNKSLLADPVDDKGSFVYGEKELWYTHSIESKTKIAFFITEDREDGLGVKGFMGGGSDPGNKQKCLREIRLYSKEDMSKPIKVIRFNYNYELCPGIPNSSTGGGKLTLKSVYFLYGNTDKGKFHPYTFSYKLKLNSQSEDAKFGYLKTDRWGTYKSDTDNQGLVDLQNDEFPYTVQNKLKADDNAAVWQLEKIDLPTGGSIQVNYESDDYAFVQNKKAMVMTGITSLINEEDNDVGILKEAKGVKVNISQGAPQGIQTSWFKNNYLNGSNYLFAKVNVYMATGNAKHHGQEYDFVSSYCKVRSVKIVDNTAYIKFEDIREAGLSINPIQQAAWQRLKNEYPRYAYPGYENRITDGSAGKAIAAAVKAIMSAVGNLGELKENFYEKSERKNYASNVRLNKSFVRLIKSDGFKLGGGLRVKKIQISDNWTAMTGDNTVPSGSYGQAYEYTRMENGKLISSGVASYEPSIGTEENPLKQPVPYMEKIKGAINNYFSLEEPFGESFFPAPSVGYSKVTVRDLKSSGSVDTDQNTGYVVNDFYTAREFPVYVNVLPIKSVPIRPQKIFSLFKTSSFHADTYSQGYSIELNDMHGKPSAVRVFNQSNKEISSTVYYYNAQDTRAGEKRLKNIVNVALEDGTVKMNRVVGRDIEFFTDLREQETVNSGETINIGLDVIPAGFFPFPLPIPHWPVKENKDYRLFRSACAVKIVQYYGVLDKVVKTENGSSIATENLVFDAITGEALVTRTQNEFNQYIYSVNLPAYWVYKAMSGSYRNLGHIFYNLKAAGGTGNGTISGAYSSHLQPGDEIVDLQKGNRYWVIDASNQQRKLVDKDGTIQTSLTIRYAKVLRSGFKNMLLPSATTIVCLENPIEDNKIKLNTTSSLASLKVLNASLNLFEEQWSVEPEPTSAESSARYVVENTDHSFNFCEGVAKPSKGAFLNFINANTTGALTSSGYWGNGVSGGPFSRSSIWPCSSGGSTEALSFDTCIIVPQSKYYYIGSGSSNQISYRFDGTTGNSISGFANRWIVAKHHLSAGSHRLRVTVYTSGASSSSNDYAGLEIYNNTVEELAQAGTSGTGINILFSTAGIRNKADLKSARISYNGAAVASTNYHYSEPNGTPADPCYAYAPAPRNRKVNPYLYGYLGNWRPSETRVYQEKRGYTDLFKPLRKGVNLKHAGILSNFFSYWYHPSTVGSVWTKNTNATEWITANTVTMYDKYGQELENRDALGRYSAAKFDFNGELPAAVASNAMNREIYVASFEDSKFASGTADRALREFTQISTNQSISPLTVKTEAHSGNYSLLLPTDGVGLSTIVHNKIHKTENYLLFDPSQGYMTKKSRGLYPSGFEPYPGKKYVISFWLKDGQAPTEIPVTVSMNLKKVTLKCKAISEGWKLVEGIIELPAASANTGFDIRMVPSANGVYADDIRIFPFDAHMKSYAYDDESLRLMAELDENGFATFYEYDDEGSLIRVKKETERGIVTLKETRSSYRKSNIN